MRVLKDLPHRDLCAFASTCKDLRRLQMADGRKVVKKDVFRGCEVTFTFLKGFDNYVFQK